MKPWLEEKCEAEDKVMKKEERTESGSRLKRSTTAKLSVDGGSGSKPRLRSGVFLIFRTISYNGV